MLLETDNTAIASIIDAPAALPRMSRSPGRPVCWEWVSQPASDLLIEQWAALAERASTSLFFTPEWSLTWHTTIGRDVLPHVLTGWDSENRLAAIWPLCVRVHRQAGMSQRVLEPMGEWRASGDRLEPLVADALPVEPELLTQARQLASTQADCIHWGELSVGSSWVKLLQSEAAQRRLRTLQRRVLPVAELPTTYEDYARQLSKKLRGYVRRQENVAIQQRGLRWRMNDEVGSLDAAIEAFIDLHGQCWRHRGFRGNYAGSPLGEFVRQFARVAHRRGWLRLHLLCDGDRPMAALMAFHHHQRAYYYQSGWDPACRELSPGSLCIAQAVRTAIEEGCHVFDFLRGDESYKRRWANRADETVTWAEAVTLRGRAMLAGYDLKQWIKRRLRGVSTWRTVADREQE